MSRKFVAKFSRCVCQGAASAVVFERARLQPLCLPGRGFTACGKSRIRHALKGHGFTACGKSRIRHALKGHGFSRAAKAHV